MTDLIPVYQQPASYLSPVAQIVASAWRGYVRFNQLQLSKNTARLYSVA
ncbi:MAG TPA: hypothetical protein VKF38_07655 [Anaerolineaceae bacterium]|nr:hypothetical protein [Anaerolineaceae bacterium]